MEKLWRHLWFPCHSRHIAHNFYLQMLACENSGLTLLAWKPPGVRRLLVCSNHFYENLLHLKTVFQNMTQWLLLTFSPWLKLSRVIFIIFPDIHKDLSLKFPHWDLTFLSNLVRKVPSSFYKLTSLSPPHFILKFFTRNTESFQVGWNCWIQEGHKGHPPLFFSFFFAPVSWGNTCAPPRSYSVNQTISQNLGIFGDISRNKIFYLHPTRLHYPTNCNPNPNPSPYGSSCKTSILDYLLGTQQ